MRIYFETMKHPKRKAKVIQDEFQARGFDYGLCRCQELIARMTGYRDWHELNTVTTKFPMQSPWDNEVEKEIVNQRHEQYIAATIDSGIDQSVAIEVVESAAPTGVRQRKVQTEDRN